MCFVIWYIRPDYTPCRDARSPLCAVISGFQFKSKTNEKPAVAIHACIVSAFNRKVVNLDKIKIKFVNFINYYYFCMSKVKFYGGMREN